MYTATPTHSHKSMVRRVREAPTMRTARSYEAIRHHLTTHQSGKVGTTARCWSVFKALTSNNVNQRSEATVGSGQGALSGLDGPGWTEWTWLARL